VFITLFSISNFTNPLGSVRKNWLEFELQKTTPEQAARWQTKDTQRRDRLRRAFPHHLVVERYKGIHMLTTGNYADFLDSVQKNRLEFESQDITPEEAAR